jgi:hypothetical protein
MGVLTFNNAPDQEVKDTDIADVTVTDHGGLTDVRTQPMSLIRL